MRLGTYIDTLELENEALREKVKALSYQVKMLEYELKKQDDEIVRLLSESVEPTNPNPFY
jgi:predicted RNase H-like nuclease (RuvC/YqgF family)